MNTNHRFFLGLALAALFFFPGTKVKADTFQIHLFYNSITGDLALDRKVSPPVAVNKGASMPIREYMEASSTGRFSYRFLDTTNEAMVGKRFEPQEGAFSIEVPYFSTAALLEVYNEVSEKPIISYDLRSYETCNNNKICEFERGENFNTCLPDCGNASVQYSQETRKLLNEQGGVLRDEETQAILLRETPAEIQEQVLGGHEGMGNNNQTYWFVGGGIVLLMLIAGRYLVKRNRAKEKIGN